MGCYQIQGKHMQKIIVPIVIFIAVLVALMFGEGLLKGLLSFLESLLGFILDLLRGIFDFVLSFSQGLLDFLQTYWNSFYTQLADFITNNPYKLLLAIIITAIASVWVFKHHGEEINVPANRRKFAIILAIFLGWLGVHKFYLGQYGKAVLYLVISVIFVPLSVLLSFIDALRFAFMDDENFHMNYPT